MEKKKQKKQPVLNPLLKKYWAPYVFGMIMLAVVDYANLYISQFTGEVIDGLTGHTLVARGLLDFAFKIVLCGLAVAIGRFTYNYFIFGSSRKIERSLRDRMFNKLESLSQRYYNRNKTGDLMSYFTNDLEALRQALGQAVVSSFDAIVLTLMVLYKMMTYVSVRLTLYTLIPMAIIACFGYFYGDKVEKRYAKKQKAFADLSDQVQESISGERVIKAFVQEDKQDKAFDEVNTNNKKANLGVAKMNAAFGPLLNLIVGATYVLAIILGGYYTMTGRITLGRFVAFNSYIGSLVWPMMALGDSITTISQGIAGLRRIHEVFDEEPDIVDDENPDDIDGLTGQISVRDLTFAYEEGLPNALSDINIEIKKGETLAILGRTGAGKTTLVNLMCRVYDLHEGSITFDGHDIKKIPLHKLRDSIAYVPQDNFLFSNTLEKNIAFGKLDATMDEIIEACKNADIHDNIVDFPDQYQTVVGERGVTLSGGQKQRSSIARAILKDSPILILDDALSAVDTDTEETILGNLKKIREGKTTIMIAHRVSTVQNADHIVVLENGKIAEYGTHDELMALGGIFSEMVEKQQLEKQLMMTE